ncbi:MAG: hypothetical protein ACK54X_23170, partial [Burkholderiales bacterium]
MELAGPVLDVVLPVYAMIAVGWAALRAGALDADGVRRCTDFTFTVFVPAQLFLAMARTDFRTLAPGVPAAYGVSGRTLCGRGGAGRRSRGRRGRAAGEGVAGGVGRW